MKVAYFALKPIAIGDGVPRQPGDLIPEATEWKYVDAYVAEGKIAPVLVATLPKAAQEKLAQWEEEQQLMVQLAAEAAADAQKTVIIEEGR